MEEIAARFEQMPAERMSQQVVRLRECFRLEDERSLGELLREEIAENRRRVQGAEEAKLFEQSDGPPLSKRDSSSDEEESSRLNDTACSTPDLQGLSES